MREAGRIAHKVCEFAGTLIKPGVTLDYIDKTVERGMEGISNRHMSIV